MAPEIKHKWRMILLCTSGTVVFWLFNALNKGYHTRVNYPVVFVVNTAKMVFVKAPPTAIPLDVTGSGWQLLKHQLNHNVTPIKVPITKVLKKGTISSDRLCNFLAKRIKSLHVNRAVLDKLDIRLRPKR